MCREAEGALNEFDGSEQCRGDIKRLWSSCRLASCSERDVEAAEANGERQCLEF